MVVKGRTVLGTVRRIAKACACLLALMLLANGSSLRAQGDIELLPPVDNLPDVSFSGDESLPLDGPVVQERGPWYQPAIWWDTDPWDMGFELGINGSEGNAQAFSIAAATNAKRKTDVTEFTLGMRYGKNQARSVLTQHFALLDSRWDWKFGESPWRLFNILNLEYDEFKAFDLRVVLNSGLGYDVIKSDPLTWTLRFGAGASREIGGGNETWIPEAVFGTDYEHKLTERQKLLFNLDYFPSWENFQDYRLVTKASWEVLLDEATNMSLKIGAVDRYDSTPNGRRPNDIDYFLTLMWKY